jgi:hypothetical protein
VQSTYTRLTLSPIRAEYLHPYRRRVDVRRSGACRRRRVVSIERGACAPQQHAILLGNALTVRMCAALHVVLLGNTCAAPQACHIDRKFALCVCSRAARHLAWRSTVRVLSATQAAIVLGMAYAQIDEHASRAQLIFCFSLRAARMLDHTSLTCRFLTHHAWPLTAHAVLRCTRASCRAGAKRHTRSVQAAPRI